MILLWRRAWEWLQRALWIIVLTALLTGSSLPVEQVGERIRTFTRAIEFDFVDWTADAILVKLTQSALGGGGYLLPDAQPEFVRAYMKLIRQINENEYYLNQAIANKISETDPDLVALRANLSDLYSQRAERQPLAESILQNQVSSVAATLGLTLWGQPIPPVLYHVTPPPSALIVSPRSEIRMDHDISILPDLGIDEEVALEAQIEANLDVSALVVGIGGIGTYPTMVMQTSSLNWMAEVVAHEWIHNLLGLRPLGVNYLTSPALRTMNETTAAIAGKEIGALVIERYYPDLVPPPPPAPAPQSPEPTPQSLRPAVPATVPEPPVFSYQHEMRETRVTTDALLAEGKIEEAEAYMEARRMVFLENGYMIRRINQAFFAFYGAYADVPGGGAAGADPVGAAVRQLRQDSPSLRAFIQRIGWMSSFEQLQQAVNGASEAPR
jgi:hypothetical protein